MKTTIKFFRNGKDIKRTSTVELSLNYNNKNQLVFSVCGNCRNLGGSGQCLDRIREYNDNPLFLEIYRLWKSYHLNDCHAGTNKQEKAIKEWKEKNNKDTYTYDEICEYLKSINLYEDNGYKYGSSWLYEEIPQEDLIKIQTIMNIYK